MTNEHRAQQLVKRYKFDFKKIPKAEIRSLIEREIADYQSGSSEYIRVLCGYLYCIGDMSDIPLLKHAKYDINMDVGCMIDGEWIESLQNGGIAADYIKSREELILDFINYYKDYSGDMEAEKTMIIFIGIQASGKTTFYNRFLKDCFKHVSLDILNTRNKESLTIKEYIEHGYSFVVDNTNPTKEDRKRYIPIAKANGYHIIGYYFKSSISECISRNEQRIGKAKVPRCAIASSSRKLELPEFNEGFDELFYVYIEDSKTIVDSWRADDEI